MLEVMDQKSIERIKKFMRKFYDKRAKFYDEIQFSNQPFHEELDSFKRLVKIKGDELVLDVATGTGIYLIEMAKKGAICYGLDISPNMLNKLKNKIEKLKIDNIKEVRTGEADKLPYPSGMFDWVTCIGLLEYYPLSYAKSVLAEIKRVLKVDGKCFIDIPNPSLGDVYRLKHIYLHDPKKFEEICKELQFTVIEKKKAGLMIQYLLKNLILGKKF